MLSRQAHHALKALLVLAADPLTWQSTHQLAAAQELPEPMLEQLLLRLRRAGVLVARRGRLGGYRLARPPRDLSLAAVLAGLGEPVVQSGLAAGEADACGEDEATPADQVTAALARRLERARQQALAQLSLEDLLFDLRSAEASAGSEAGLLLG
ncbi:MAG: Rrf2 family transcriptional regulator [Cyanobacteria bacterium K_DeepCast_35m_m2_023]|nr:Rrf2 family transcriptional regulator [Cyanobacteria bacterium K_DeepCast_35m_m2_023]